MSTPSGLKISESHEWHRVEGDVVVVGITKHAVDELTDVTFVELKDAGESIGAGDAIGEVESVKATSDVYCSVSGEIEAVNTAVVAAPSSMHRDRYGVCWILKVKAEGQWEQGGSRPSASEDCADGEVVWGGVRRVLVTSW